MTEEDAFSAAILAAPRDDLPRLVFADWLDERGGPGDAARAEFIRLTVGDPDTTFWPPGRAPVGSAPRPHTDRASELCCENWQDWAEVLRHRLAGTPLHRWLGTDDCRWGYRRGFVAAFEGTQQVLLDAWDYLFRLGPVEEVRVNNLWHLGTVMSLRLFLDKPSLRVLRLHAAELRDDCVDQLRGASDWLGRLDRVELHAQNPDGPAERRLLAWLTEEPSLNQIHWRGRVIR